MERAGAVLSLERPEAIREAERSTLMKVEAFLEPSKFERILETLRALHVPTIIVSQVRIDAGANAPTSVYRGIEYRADFQARLKLELIAPAHQVEDILEALSRSARTRQRFDDDKIIVYSIREAKSIR